MRINFDSIKPIYIQIAEAIEDEIVLGNLREGEPAYSQLLLSRELNINPATAAKGISQLVRKGILEKQRGQSMIVAPGAKERLLRENREQLFAIAAKDLVNQAIKIELPEEQVLEIIRTLFAGRERGEQDE